VISTRKGFLFVHIPKSAGNSIQDVLAPFADDRIVCTHSDHDGVESFELSNESLGTRKHATLAQYRRALPNELYRSLFKFTCVRNPWDRMVSHFFFKRRKRGRDDFDADEFRRFIAKRSPATYYLATRSWCRRLGFGSSRLAAPSPFSELDFYLRFERLNEDFRTLCARLAIPFEPLPIRNQSDHDHYSRYYDAATYSAVRHRFRDEIAFFGFRFETL